MAWQTKVQIRAADRPTHRVVTLPGEATRDEVAAIPLAPGEAVYSVWTEHIPTPRQDRPVRSCEPAPRQGVCPRCGTYCDGDCRS